MASNRSSAVRAEACSGRWIYTGRSLLFGQDAQVGPWVMAAAGGIWREGAPTIGLLRQGRLSAGLVYENYNGRNVFVHYRVEGAHAGTRDFLWAAFHYPLVQLGCERITGLIAAGNARSRALAENLGLELEATMHGAAADGSDLLIYVMWKARCRWLRLRPRAFVEGD